MTVAKPVCACVEQPTTGSRDVTLRLQMHDGRHLELLFEVDAALRLGHGLLDAAGGHRHPVGTIRLATPDEAA
jgi:hypothetical protein